MLLLGKLHFIYSRLWYSNCIICYFVLFGWQKEEAAHQHQFILHAALDIVQDLAWTTSAMWVSSP